MKMVTAVIQEEDATPLIASLVEAGFHATKIASTGGFLSRGNVTLLIGANDEDVPLLVDYIRKGCHSRTVMMGSTEVAVGGAVIFVQEIAEYYRV
ncbi:MAG: cyclic-di-AMP receptor [Dehalococcoidia bacterium]